MLIRLFFFSLPGYHSLVECLAQKVPKRHGSLYMFCAMVLPCDGLVFWFLYNEQMLLIPILPVVFLCLNSTYKKKNSVLHALNAFLPIFCSKISVLIANVHY